MTDEVSLDSKTYSKCERERKIARNDGRTEAVYELFNSHHYKQQFASVSGTLCLRALYLPPVSGAPAVTPAPTSPEDQSLEAGRGDSERCEQ